MNDPRTDLLKIYQAALNRVSGHRVVQDWLNQRDYPSCSVVAIGKAALAMAEGALDELGGRLLSGLVITKHGHGECGTDFPMQVIEASHPLPDESSLVAGQTLQDFLRQMPADRQLLFLISGGASSLVEVLAPGIGLEDLQRANSWLLGSGLAIDQINRVRRGLSLIKAGGLRHQLAGRPTDVLLISDVPDNDPAVIGSGMLVDQQSAHECELPAMPEWLQALCQSQSSPVARDFDCNHHLLCSLEDALDAAATEAGRFGYAVTRYPGIVQGDTLELGKEMAAAVCSGPAGIYLWGGETTLNLPADPGKGGRNQHLALSVATVLAGRDDVLFLSAGTDGTDGPTGDAGALVDGATLERASLDGFDADYCLRRADSGSLLAASGDLIHTGPTGSNVMDLMIGLKL